jgi:uncharacterized protein (UPF0333 family)
MKGQISFDFIIAVTVALTLILSVSFISEGIQSQQKTASVSVQAKNIALNVAKVINAYEKLAERNETGTTIKYDVPKIKTNDGEIDCAVSVESGRVTVSGDGFSESVPVVTTKSIDSSCGSVLEVEK